MQPVTEKTRPVKLAKRIATFAWLVIGLVAATGCQCFSIPSVRYHEPCGPGTAAPLPCDEAYEMTQAEYAEEAAPPARFHPVPTRPVFAASAAIAARDTTVTIPNVQLHAPQLGPPQPAPAASEPPRSRAPEELAPPAVPEAASEPEAAPIQPPDRGFTRRAGRGDIRFITGAENSTADRWRIKQP